MKHTFDTVFYNLFSSTRDILSLNVKPVLYYVTVLNSDTKINSGKLNPSDTLHQIYKRNYKTEKI